MTFIAKAAEDDLDALDLAAEIAASHDCVGVFVWEPAAAVEGRDRFVGEVDRRGGEMLHEPMPQRGASLAV